MTKCLLKALKAVDLQNHINSFQSLGYDSAGALAHFHNHHFNQLHLSDRELNRFHALLDVLKEATREGKICPHYCKSSRHSIDKNQPKRAKSSETDFNRNSQTFKTTYSHLNKQSNENLRSKRSLSSNAIAGRSSSLSSTSNKSQSNGFTVERSSSNYNERQKSNGQQFFGPKSSNRPAIQHVKVQSYNYGVPAPNKIQRNGSHRVQYQSEPKSDHSTIFVTSSHNSTETTTYAKPAEIYVYARKRPLLSNELHFQDSLSVPDNKHMIVTENKANLDCTPLLKKSEFYFDQVFGSDASNKQIFEWTVLPFLSSSQRQNLTYICFGQTGSGKSHTIFGTKSNDGLLFYCAQLLLQETNLQTRLVCTFYEIYNNQVYDLTNTGKRLFVREDGQHRVNIVGLTEISLRNLDTLRSVISDGLSRRHHGKSAFNSNSSRSHAVFQLILKNNSNQTNNFRLVFIDLAGSERATDAQNNQKQTRREGAQINSSLLALKECIRSMDLTQVHTPFRQTKLTHILRDSFVGSKHRTCLMANVSPADDCCQCSLNTLQYASRIRDISIRHRHRSVPVAEKQKNYIEDEPQQPSQYHQHQHSHAPFVREQPQRTFKPSTASTPVHRLLSSVDHQTYMATHHTGHDSHKQLIKSSDFDWQFVEDDVPISGSGDNPRLKSTLSTTREFIVNGNNNNKQKSTTNSSSFYLTRYEQQRKKYHEKDDEPSSYFPHPQSDIKRTSPTPMNNTKNEQQYKPATISSFPIRRSSQSSSEPPTSSRLASMGMIQSSDDNQYSSTTATESLGAKITKLASGNNNPLKLNQEKYFLENLNLNQQYETGTTTTITTDAEQGFYSDRQATHRDQTGFFSNRDDPSYENHDVKSNYLTTITQRTSPITTASTPKNTSQQFQPGIESPTLKHSFSSPNKNHNRNHSLKSSSSSSSSLDSVKDVYPSPKRQHRKIPFHNNSHSYDNQHDRTTSSTRDESSQTIQNNIKMITEQEQTDEQFLMEQFIQEKSTNFMHAPLDLLKRHYDQTLSKSTPFTSPSKNIAVNVSDHLNNLRQLLETRLVENTKTHSSKDLSILQTSPGTFTKEFLQSYSKLKSPTNDVVSDIDDDENDNQIEHNTDYKRRSFLSTDRTKDKYGSDILTPSTILSKNHRQNDLSFSPQIKYNSTPILSSTSRFTERTNLHEPRVLSSYGNGTHSHLSTDNTPQGLISKNDLTAINTSNPTSDIDYKSDVTYESQNDYRRKSSECSSLTDLQSNSSISHQSLGNFNHINDHGDLLDNIETSSLLRGTSFDVLLNNLKSMREKDLDSIIESSDDSIIRNNNK